MPIAASPGTGSAEGRSGGRHPEPDATFCRARSDILSRHPPAPADPPVAALPDFDESLAGNLLLVDDHADHRSAMAVILRRGGHEVAEAVDGRQALGLLRAGGVEAVVTDLRMPDVGGIAVLRAASAETPPVPVVIVTGYATVESGGLGEDSPPRRTYGQHRRSCDTIWNRWAASQRIGVVGHLA